MEARSITIDGTTYLFKDEEARERIEVSVGMAYTNLGTQSGSVSLTFPATQRAYQELDTNGNITVNITAENTGENCLLVNNTGSSDIEVSIGQVNQLEQTAVKTPEDGIVVPAGGSTEIWITVFANRAVVTLRSMTETSAAPVLDSVDYPCFTNTNSGASTISMSHQGTNASSTKPVIYYSFDKSNWILWDFSAVTVQMGETIYFKGENNSRIGSSASDYSQFAMTGKFRASGNLMYILSTTPPSIASYCFYRLFSDCSVLVSAPELPAKTLADHCYSLMFYNCSALTRPPELPATTLGTNCYDQMFYKCAAMKYAPALLATTLVDYCYRAMFMDCTSLVDAPLILGTTLASYCCAEMFYGCTSLASPPDLPATSLKTYCYSEMFRGCTSLVSSPLLRATSITTSRVYNKMFYGCTSLRAVFIKATSITSSALTKPLDAWLTGVPNVGAFFCNSSPSYSSGDGGMPSGWTKFTIY